MKKKEKDTPSVSVVWFMMGRSSLVFHVSQSYTNTVSESTRVKKNTIESIKKKKELKYYRLLSKKCLDATTNNTNITTRGLN